MTPVWTLFTLWIGLALIAGLLSVWLRVSTALTEICVGTAAQLIIGTAFGATVLGSDEGWIKFLAGIGAIMLTFLAGAELDPVVFKKKWKEATALGLVGFFAPVPGLHRGRALRSRLGRDAELARRRRPLHHVGRCGLCRDDRIRAEQDRIRQAVLAACFINDLGTVLALGFIFAPFTLHTLIFAVVAVVVFAALPWLTPRFNRMFGNRPSEMEIKFLLFCLLGLGALAGWADSEAVLPAYIIGMMLAGTVGKDHALVRRLRAMTMGLMTPFYFIRAGAFVSIPALIAAPFAFFFMLGAKMVSKFCGVYPVTRIYKTPNPEAMYTTLMMSTGLTFGTISSLFGLSHGIISQAQYSILVAGVIGSAVIPTLIANIFYLPHHLLPEQQQEVERILSEPTGAVDLPQTE